MVDSYDSSPVTKTGSWLNLLIGLWLIVAPYVLVFSGTRAALQNSMGVGILVAIFALVSALAVRALWSHWVNIVLGVWLFFAPFIFSYSSVSSALWNSIIFGVLIVVFAAWSASAVSGHAQQH